MEELFQTKDAVGFVRVAYKIYCDRKVIHVWGIEFDNRARGNKYINFLYKLGRDYHKIPFSFQEFGRILLDTHKTYSHGKYRNRVSYNYWFSKNYQYRVSPHFVFRGEQKKEKSARTEWREYSGIVRDKRKGYLHHRHHGKKDLKFFTKRKHRQFERAALSSGNYDVLHNKTWKTMEDYWNWD